LHIIITQRDFCFPFSLYKRIRDKQPSGKYFCYISVAFLCSFCSPNMWWRFVVILLLLLLLSSNIIVIFKNIKFYSWTYSPRQLAGNIKYFCVNVIFCLISQRVSVIGTLEAKGVMIMYLVIFRINCSIFVHGNRIVLYWISYAFSSVLVGTF